MSVEFVEKSSFIGKREQDTKPIHTTLAGNLNVNDARSHSIVKIDSMLTSKPALVAKRQSSNVKYVSFGSNVKKLTKNT